jgi:uncharacterized membrane protein YciS (DUF1049 family)
MNIISFISGVIVGAVIAGLFIMKVFISIFVDEIKSNWKKDRMDSPVTKKLRELIELEKNNNLS